VALLNEVSDRLPVLEAQFAKPSSLPPLATLEQVQSSIQDLRELLGELSGSGQNTAQAVEWRTRNNNLAAQVTTLLARRQYIVAQLELFRTALANQNFEGTQTILERIKEESSDNEVHTASQLLDNQRGAQELYVLAQKDLVLTNYAAAIKRFNAYHDKGGDSLKAEEGMHKAQEHLLMEDVERYLKLGQIQNAYDSLQEIISKKGDLRQQAEEKLKEIELRLDQDQEIVTNFGIAKSDYERFLNMPDLLNKVNSIMEVFSTLKSLGEKPSSVQSQISAFKRQIEEQVRRDFESVITKLDSLIKDEDNGQRKLPNEYTGICNFIEAVEEQIKLKGDREKTAKVTAKVR
jgi:hypothetical protein